MVSGVPGLAGSLPLGRNDAAEGGGDSATTKGAADAGNGAEAAVSDANTQSAENLDVDADKKALEDLCPLCQSKRVGRAQTDYNVLHNMLYIYTCAPVHQRDRFVCLVTCC